jgi:stage II sporulation protein D
MKTNIRLYRDNDFSDLLALLTGNLPYEELSEELVREKLYSDPDWSTGSALVAEEGEVIAGFMMGVVREIRGIKYGFIKLMAVDKGCRRKGIASSMYKMIEQDFIRRGAACVRICDVPLNYLVPGIDPRYTEAVCFALKHGFDRNGEAVNMRVDLNCSDWNTTNEVKELSHKGVDIRRCTAQDLPQLIEFISAEWALWEHELRMAAKNNPPSLFLALQDKKIVAFAAYDGNNKGTGWFGPMGTDPAQRGSGLGRILLFKCLEEMHRQGKQTATIPWVAPIGFYAHHAHARISRTFWRFEKKLLKPEPDIHVGIVSRKSLSVRLKGSYQLQEIVFRNDDLLSVSAAEGRLVIASGDQKVVTDSGAMLKSQAFDADHFEIEDVVIGVGFHWEKEECQIFRGSLQLISRKDIVTAINILPLEHYLQSVISSEMSAHASLNLLRAHAIISRSWLMAQIEKQDQGAAGRKADNTPTGDTDRLIKWFGRDDHDDFHVCADDHCQRYQGITRLKSEKVVQAVHDTRGEVLMFEGALCDTRYSKSCGGVTETFENCWEPVHHPYLESIADVEGMAGRQPPDLTIEKNASGFILGSPKAFCNTTDKTILSQVLNDFDRSTENFFRWTVRYEQEELSTIILERSGYDFGNIVSLVPLQRGRSGRLTELLIKGTKRTMVIGKELLIRKWLSRSHLYSAAFVIREERDAESSLPRAFVLKGAGWGHGVGLCQIGAAVMGEKGYAHSDILAHYYPGSEIKKIFA